MDITQKTIDHHRRQLVDRGYREITWVKPAAVTTDVIMPILETSAFLSCWEGDAADLLASYCELMGIDKRPPKASAKRFHDRGKLYRDEMERIDDRVTKGLLTPEQADEVHDLRDRIIWAHYRELADAESGRGDIPESYLLRAPAGFLLGHLINRDEITAREWELANRGQTFDDDFRTWLEVVRG